MPEAWLLAPLVLLAAMLYASVGHGGASAYLAILVLAGFALPEIRPVVLLMNIGVAATAFWSYRGAGHFRPRLLWPFVVAAMPAAFVGGLLRLPLVAQEALLGVALAAAAVRFLAFPTLPPLGGARPPPLAVALPVGALLGFLAGATGIGGGVYLTPLLLIARWADAKPAAAASAGFIVLNSATGLLGNLVGGAEVRLDLLAPLLAGALAGGFVGSWVGARRLSPVMVQRSLGVVLLLAAGRAFL